MLTLTGGMPRETIDGFSHHAAMCSEALDRSRLVQAYRYMIRPAPSKDRDQCNAAGRMELKPKTPRRDGTTHLVMSLVGFM